MRDLDASTFDATLATGPVVVDFWAPWCKPCRTVEAVLGELEEENAGRIGFARLNIEEHPDIAARFDVLSIPTVIVFEAGEPVETVIGARSRSHFERLLASWLAASPTA